MNREEEIIKTARFIYEPCIPQSLQMRAGFIDGAKWADKTMIEKAYKWLKENADGYLDWYNWDECRLNTDTLLYDFLKAMEE